MLKEINFILNNELVKIKDIDPNVTVLNYLREIKNQNLFLKTFFLLKQISSLIFFIIFISKCAIGKFFQRKLYYIYNF